MFSDGFWSQTSENKSWVKGWRKHFGVLFTENQSIIIELSDQELQAAESKDFKDNH